MFACIALDGDDQGVGLADVNIAPQPALQVQEPLFDDTFAGDLSAAATAGQARVCAYRRGAVLHALDAGGCDRDWAFILDAGGGFVDLAFFVQ